MDLFNKKAVGKVRTTLLKRKETIAVAESVTAGLLQFALSAIPDAAQFWQGGITAYNIAQKYKHLQVEPTHALVVNCVSQKVAVEMATHVCGLFASDWGIGITGYASPVPESDQKLFAFYAIVYKGRIKAQGKLTATIDEPAAVQSKYVQTILSKLATLF